MKRLVTNLIAAAGLAGLAGLAAQASAQVDNTNLRFEVSTDGLNWGSEVSHNPNEGQRRILVRVMVSWESTGTTVPIGFASMTFQPVITSVRFGDSVVNFANQGNNTNGGGVTLDATPLDGPFGRLRPFAATGPSGLQSYSTHAHTNGSGGAPMGSYIRFARNDISNWMGMGPTTGSDAVNNFNGAGGIAAVQKSLGLLTPGIDPPFHFGITDINIFQFAIDVDTLAPGEQRTLSLLAPLEGISRDLTSGVRSASWFASNSDNFGTIKAPVNVSGAQINLVPSPAALSLLMCGGLTLNRRSRNKTKHG